MGNLILCIIRKSCHFVCHICYSLYFKDECQQRSTFIARDNCWRYLSWTNSLALVKDTYQTGKIYLSCWLSLSKSVKVKNGMYVKERKGTFQTIIKSCFKGNGLKNVILKLSLRVFPTKLSFKLPLRSPWSN